MAIILTSHQIDVVQKLSSKIYLLRNGELIDGTEYLTKFPSKYKIRYRKNGKLKSKILRGNLSELESVCKWSDIEEIIQEEEDLEKILVEKLR